MKPLLKLLIVLAGCTTLAAVAHDEHAHEREHEGLEQHGAHVHGIGELNLVQQGAVLQMELLLPAANITGFEHQPGTPQQQQQLDKAIAQLQSAELFSIAGGDCRHSRSHAGLHSGDGHADIELTVQYTCKQSAEIDSLAITIFTAFGSLQSLNAQWIFAGQQGSDVLTADNNRIKVR